MRLDPATEDLLRAEAPQVLGALVRRYGHFDLAEDAVQEALLAAAQQWPTQGIPEHPRGWLIRVAARTLTDMLRSESARRRREEEQAAESSAFSGAGHDDTLAVLFMCCHARLSPASAVALTLRAVGGLTTDEIARAFGVPAATIGQRISRAKATIAASGEPFRMPSAAELESRLALVLRVLYLVFNEGYVASSGENLTRVDLSGEAIRIGRLLHAAFPRHGEVAGLLALMLLTEARRPARVTADGSAVPLAEQDRGLWHRGLIAEGTALVQRAMRGSRLGAYQIQAAIAALHDEAVRPADTDWPQILALYTLLLRYDDSPTVVLNRAVAIAYVLGPHAGLAELAALDHTPRNGGHRVTAVRAHLLEMAGDTDGARAAYLHAARTTLSLPERRYLTARATRLAASP